MNDIFWIESEPALGLAVVLRPRGNDWLESELQRLKSAGVDTLVSMLERDEAESLGLMNEGACAHSLGLDFIAFPIADRSLPSDVPAFRRFIHDLAARIRNGHRIGVHCRASIGRASIACACTLIAFGRPSQEALNAVATARGCLVPDTPEQQDWILRFQASL